MKRSHPLVAFLFSVSLVALQPGLPAQFQREPKAGRWTQHIKARYAKKGWVVHETRHYQIQSQAGKEKALRLAKHMEAMLRVYKKLFKPDRSSFNRYPIKLFKDRAEFIKYGASPGAGAYYSPTEKEMVCYDTGKWMDEEKAAAPATGGKGPKTPPKYDFREQMKMDILGAAAHEGWHQYFHWYITSWVPINSWINEGMGDYFYCARPIKVKGRKLNAELGRLNGMRLLTIYSAVKQKKHVPIKKIIHYTKQQYYANPGLCYAEGWALCHFLLHSKNKKYKRAVPYFIHLVEDDTNMKKITEKAFRGIDMDKLDEDFQKWVLEVGKKEFGNDG